MDLLKSQSGKLGLARNNIGSAVSDGPTTFGTFLDRTDLIKFRHHQV